MACPAPAIRNAALSSKVFWMCAEAAARDVCRHGYGCRNRSPWCTLAGHGWVVQLRRLETRAAFVPRQPLRLVSSPFNPDEIVAVTIQGTLGAPPCFDGPESPRFGPLETDKRVARRIYLTEYNSGRIVVIDCLRGSNNIYCSTDSSFCTRRHLHNANQGVCNTGYRYGSDNNNGMSGVLKRRYIRLGGVETKEANCTTAGLAINSGGDLLAVAVQPPYPYIDGGGEHGVRVFDRLREIELYRLVFDDAGCRWPCGLCFTNHADTTCLAVCDFNGGRIHLVPVHGVDARRSAAIASATRVNADQADARANSADTALGAMQPVLAPEPVSNALRFMLPGDSVPSGIASIPGSDTEFATVFYGRTLATVSLPADLAFPPEHDGQGDWVDPQAQAPHRLKACRYPAGRIPGTKPMFVDPCGVAAVSRDGNALAICDAGQRAVVFVDYGPPPPPVSTAHGARPPASPKKKPRKPTLTAVDYVTGERFTPRKDRTKWQPEVDDWMWSGVGYAFDNGDIIVSCPKLDAGTKGDIFIF